ncbi:MAG: hypothetical protein GX756_04110 [Clostridiales bacterium]|nr:hypothetical protein [Clostridiales bacterium]
MGDCANSFVTISEASGLTSDEIITKLNQNKQKNNIVVNDFERLRPKQKSDFIKKLAREMCYHYYSNDGKMDLDMLDEWIEILSRMVGFENHAVKMSYLQKRIKMRKVVFLGATGKGHLSRQDIKHICKSYGFLENQIEIRDDYSKLPNLKLDNLKNDRRYLGIVVGAIPHSIKGVPNGNLFQYLEDNACDFPPVRVCKDSNDALGFSASAVKKALSELIRLAANT